MTLLSKTFADVLTLNRASVGSYYDANGVLQVAASGQPRLTHDPVTKAAKGLLSEESRTNLLTHSSDFHLRGWEGFNGGTYTPDNELSPDGTIKATLIDLSASSTAYVFLSGFSSSGATTVCYSFFVKGAAGETVSVKFNTNAQATILTSDGAIAGGTLAAKNHTLTGEWQRVSLYVSLSNAVTSGYLYLGDRRSGQTAKLFHVWGAQLEAGAFPTSYIPTVASQVTRAADDLSVTTTSPWHRLEEGTWEIDIDTNGKAVRTLGYGDAFLADLVSGKGKVVVKYEAGIGSLWVAGAKLYEFQKEHGFDLASLVKMAKGGGSTIEKALYTPHAKTDAEAAALATGNLVVVDKKVGPMVPSLSLDYVAGKYSKGLVDSDFNIHTFSRASTGSYWDSNGVLQQAAVNAPRFDYDPVTKVIKGLFVEESRTNLLAYSEDYSNAAWSKSHGTGVARAGKVAPDGTLTAYKLTEGSTDQSHNFNQVTSSTGQRTLSAFFMAGTLGKVALQMSDLATSTVAAVFDLNAGTVITHSGGSWTGLSGSIVSVGGGWFRCSFTATPGAGTQIRALIAPARLATSYLGDGASYAYIWGAQLEAGAFPTSYIPSADTWISRASTATYFDANGVMQTAGSGVARSNAHGFDSTGAIKPIGLLLEGAATNVLLRTSTPRDWSLSGTTLGARTTNPEGYLVEKIVETGAGTILHSPNVVGANLTAGEVYTASVYAKAAERTVFQMRIPNAHNTDATFDLTAKTANPAANTPTVSIASVGGGWFRCSMTFTAIATGSENLRLSLISAGTTNYVADNVSGIYLWGAQLETGSVATSYIPSTDTFTRRASTATYLNAAGVLQTAAVDVARSNAYAYDSAGVLKPVGLLLEASATNRALHSGNPSNGAWIAITATRAAGSAWNGMTGCVVGSMGNDWNRLRASEVAPVSTSEVVTFFYKAGTSGRIRVTCRNETQALESAAKGVIGSTYTVTTAAGGLTVLQDNAVSSGVRKVTVRFQATTPGDNHSFAISPDSNVSGETIEVFGVQLEAGSYATSYIPTTTAQVTRAADVSTSVAGGRAADVSTSSQVTRAADVCRVNTLSPWYNATEGSLVVSYISGYTTGYPRVVAFDAGAGQATSMQVIKYAGAGSVSVSAYQGGIPVGNPGGGSAPPGTVNQAAFSYSGGGLAFSSNGSAVTKSGAMATIPAVTKLNIGMISDGSQLGGHIRALRYYPRKLSDADLQTLTTP